jgi:hypothetical protein
MRSALLGPYNLNYDELELFVPKSQCGIFALGHVDRAQIFRVERVGRADTDLRSSLRELIGSSIGFKFAPLSTPREAFEQECELFHRLKPPGNFIHPVRQAGAIWFCPICSQFSGR